MKNSEARIDFLSCVLRLEVRGLDGVVRQLEFTHDVGQTPDRVQTFMR